MTTPLVMPPPMGHAEPYLRPHATLSSSTSSSLLSPSSTHTNSTPLHPPPPLPQSTPHTRTSSPRSSSPLSRLPSWFLPLLSLAFLSLTLALLLAPTPTTHPCPYADVLGLTPSPPSSTLSPATVDPASALPPGHPPSAGLSEDDCPHLTIQRLARERLQQREERESRRALGDIAVAQDADADEAPYLDE